MKIYLRNEGYHINTKTAGGGWGKKCRYLNFFDSIKCIYNVSNKRNR